LEETIDSTIRFNYLGQVALEHPALDYVSLEDTFSGLVDPEGRMSPPIEINSMIGNSRLIIAIKYNSTVFSKAAMNEFIDLFKAHLTNVIDYTCNPNREYRFAPSDFASANLSTEDIAILFE